MSEELEALEVSKQLKDFVLKFVKNGLDRRLIYGSFDIIEKELKEYQEMKAVKGTTTFDKSIEDTLINACPNVAKKLKRLEELEKAFDSLSKDDEKAKELLSLEIEKNRALEIIKKYIRVDKPFNMACYIYLNDESEMIAEEEYNLLKEVLSYGK